ncbi:MAG: DUF3791 domain-containing protein [Acinetobacter sp.]|nr:DUF3791 domain-containing protein [Acinetobacter sp.]
MTTSTIVCAEKHLEFILFCIDFIAQKLEQSPDVIYQKLRDSGLLQDYIIAHYDVLHTQDKDYIIDDIVALMKAKGIM